MIKIILNLKLVQLKSKRLKIKFIDESDYMMSKAIKSMKQM